MQNYESVLKKCLDTSIYQIKRREIIKNNDTVKIGYEITRDNKGVILYQEMLDEFYSHNDFAKEIADYVESCFSDQKEVTASLNAIESFRDKGDLSNVFMYAVNGEKNRKYLEDPIKKEHLDLALVPYIAVTCDGGSCKTTITKEMLEHSGITEEQLFSKLEHSIVDSRGFVVDSLLDLILKMTGQDFCDFRNEDFPEALIVNTPSDSLMRSPVLLAYPDKLQMILSEAGYIYDSFYILPSSTYELLILENVDAIDPLYLRSMVQEVNADAVSSEDFLSDNIYLYKEGSITVVNL